MLAKPTPELPIGEGWRYEPKWDGFRALVFRDGPELYLQSRDLKPLDRYFPSCSSGRSPKTAHARSHAPGSPTATR